MFILLFVPFALALAVVSILGLVGVGPLTDDRRADRSGITGTVGPVIGLLIGVGSLVLAVGALVVLGGIGGRGGNHDEPRAIPASPQRTRDVAPTTTPSQPTTPPVVEAIRPVVPGPAVSIEAEDGASFPISYDVADGLVSPTVLRIRVTGFEPFARATAQQCQREGRRCGNSNPVQFDADGNAQFQYFVTDRFLGVQPIPGRCGANAAPCSVVVRALTGDRHGEVQTVFGAEVAPAGRVFVTPASGLSLEGETVTVQVENYPPGALLTALVCAAPDATGPRCGLPGPTAPLTVARDGTGRTELVIAPSRVGAERASCFRGDDCGISVASDEVFARAPVVPISFAAPPGADYDPTRLLIGLGLALLLLLFATVLLWRTDWSAIGEAAAPEIDNAEYADLDAIIAALPPVEDESLSMH